MSRHLALPTDPILGPVSIADVDGVEVSVDEVHAASGGVRVRMTATRDLTGCATGRFSRPTAGLRWTAVPTDDDTIEHLGFAFTQFALPVVACAGSAKPPG